MCSQRTPSNNHHNHQQESYSPSESQNNSSPRYSQNQRNQQSYEVSLKTFSRGNFRTICKKHEFVCKSQRSPEDSPQISGNYRDPRGHMSTSMSTHSMKV